MEKIKSYFERYPQSREVFENDGVLFHDRGAAESYGKGEYTRFTRKQVEEAPVVDTEDEAELAAKELAEKEAAELAAKELAEKEAAELAAKELADKEAAEKAAELAAKEQVDKEADELAAKEPAEKKAAEDSAAMEAAKLTLGGKEVETIPLKVVNKSNPPKTNK